MSYILDALRKAERDRSLGQAPRIEDVALAPESAPQASAGAHLGRRRLFVIAVLLAVTGLTAWWLLRAPAPAPSAPPPPPSGVVTATVRGPASLAASSPALPAAKPRDDAPPALAADEPVATLDDLAPSAAARSDGSAADDGSGAVREQDFIAHPAAADAAATAAAPTARPTPPTITIPATAEPAADSISSNGSSATPLESMPSSYRGDFPKLTVEVHVWDSEAAKRFVLVNGHRYTEGQTMAEGPTLAEIAQQGLVLDYRGSRVLFPIE